MNKIIRTFHPVGQGAFYSERHEDFNVVYDCGVESIQLPNKGIKRTVETAFSKDEETDILFISHFHFDHVGHISTLKSSVKKIKKVVLPLLHDETKILLSNFYKAIGATEIVNLILNPQDFFGEETTIIGVELSENGETPIIDNSESLDIDSLHNAPKIKSGSGIKKTFSNYDWTYIPYNYDYKNRNSALEVELEKEGFDVAKMKTDTNYALDKIEKDVSKVKKNGGKKFQEIYTRLNGKINQNSMVVYSGVTDNAKHNFNVCNLFHNSCCIDDCFYHRCCRRSFYEDRVSCIYTGDTDLNIVKIKSIFGKYWDNIGLIQVPHHGDAKSFNTDILDSPKLCPISVGKNNSYGHPSDKVLIDILSHDSYPIFVTEDKNSIFVQVIITH